MLIAACGGTAYGGTSTTGGVAGANATAAPVVATVAVSASSLGQILTDDKGRTLYLFEKDTATMSACAGACASAWPPFTSGAAPIAGSGATASVLTTVTRGDGSKQVTYNGHPLYYYAGDQKPGDTSGQNLDQFGGSWYVLSPAGMQIGN
ncbi:MAG TPA: hypothetical protein VN193_09735 [Candidatus Angelobacter sp.]|nr:hypothetical protein [Candidatus Angelobacter sp.]